MSTAAAPQNNKSRSTVHARRFVILNCRKCFRCSGLQPSRVCSRWSTQNSSSKSTNHLGSLHFGSGQVYTSESQNSDRNSENWPLVFRSATAAAWDCNSTFDTEFLEWSTAQDGRVWGGHPAVRPWHFAHSPVNAVAIVIADLGWPLPHCFTYYFVLQVTWCFSVASTYLQSHRKPWPTATSFLEALNELNQEISRFGRSAAQRIRGIVFDRPPSSASWALCVLSV